MSHPTSTLSPRLEGKETVTRSSTQTKRHSFFPAPQLSRESREFPITSAPPHIATSQPSASSPSLNHSMSPSPSPSRPTRQLLSTPPSPSALGTNTPASNPTATMQHPAVAAGAVEGEAGSANNAHEKMWLEMQQKLEEVSLSGDHVFGSNHAKSLEALRAAQVELAQAWVRSEEDDMDNKHSEFGKQAFTGWAGGEGAVSDILLAGERRRANDEHFHRVEMSVVDVTRKLENVARAMAGVEFESRRIWTMSSDSEGSSIR